MELILRTLSILLLFLFLMRINGDLKFSLIGLTSFISLPWFIYLTPGFNIHFFLFLATLLLCIIFSTKIKLYAKRVSLGILCFSLMIFLASMLTIPNDVQLSLVLQSNSAGRSEIKLPFRIFVNKLVVSYKYREGLVFENLDFGNYFFVGHPRERVGVYETLKVYLFFLPLIVIGLMKTELRLRLFMLSVASASISVAVFWAERNPNGNFAITIPIVYFATQGVISLLSWLKRGYYGKV